MSVTAPAARLLSPAEAASLRPRIEALLADYAHTIDEDRLEQWPDLFTEGARYRVITRENLDQGLPVSLIYCDGRGMLKDRIAALRTANIFEPHVYCHMTSAIAISGAAEGGWSVRSNFTVIRTMQAGDMAIFACGRAIDRVVEVGDMLKIAERTVVLDSRRVDTLLVIPI